MEQKELAKEKLSGVRKDLGCLAIKDNTSVYADAEQALETAYLHGEYGMIIVLCNVIKRIIEYYKRKENSNDNF